MVCVATGECIDRRTHGGIIRQTGRQTDRQTHRQTDSETDRQIVRQTDSPPDRRTTDQPTNRPTGGRADGLSVHQALGLLRSADRGARLRARAPVRTARRRTSRRAARARLGARRLCGERAPAPVADARSRATMRVLRWDFSTSESFEPDHMCVKRNAVAVRDLEER